MTINFANHQRSSSLTISKVDEKICLSQKLKAQLLLEIKGIDLRLR